MELFGLDLTTLGVILLAAHTLLKAISRVTKTQKDDAIIDQIGSILGYLFGKDPSGK